MTLTELESYFAGVEIPDNIELGRGLTITNVPAFIESHLTVLKQNDHLPAYKSFKNRLMILKGILEGNTGLIEN